MTMSEVLDNILEDYNPDSFDYMKSSYIIKTIDLIKKIEDSIEDFEDIGILRHKMLMQFGHKTGDDKVIQQLQEKLYRTTGKAVKVWENYLD